MGEGGQVIGQNTEEDRDEGDLQRQSGGGCISANTVRADGDPEEVLATGMLLERNRGE